METVPEDQVVDRAVAELALQRKLVNRTVLAFALCIYAAALVRTFSVGWQVRDYLQTAVFILALLLVLLRRKVLARHQIVFIVAICIVVGFLGLHTLAFLAGGIVCLPTAAVVMSLYYSRRTVVAFVLLCFAGIILIALGYASGYLELSAAPETLLRSYSHWTAYILCMGLFCVIGCGSILAYRHAMETLLHEVHQQREDLEETNTRLQDALMEIKTLKGTLPTCQYCKRIRPLERDQDDERPWIPIETYVREHSEASFSHGICPDCMREHFREKGER